MKEEQINRVYAGGAKCASRYVKFRKACDEMKAAHQTVGGQAVDEGARDAFRKSYEGLARRVRASESRLVPLREVLDVVSEGPVECLYGMGTSYLEALLALARKDLDLAKPVLHVSSWDGEKSWLLEGGMVRRGHGEGTQFIRFSVEEAKARLRIESAHLKRFMFGDGVVGRGEPGLWVIRNGRVQLEGALDDLTGQSRKLLRYFIRRQGQETRYQDLADDVFGDEFTRQGTMHQAVGQLRKDLKALGMEEVGYRIQALGGSIGYRFVRGESRDLSGSERLLTRA